MTDNEILTRLSNVNYASTPIRKIKKNTTAQTENTIFITIFIYCMDTVIGKTIRKQD